MALSKGYRCNKFCIVFLVTFFISFTKEVQLPDDVTPKHTISKSSELNVCLKPERPSNDLLTCFSHQVLKKMQDLEENDEFSLSDGISMRRDEAGPRDISNFLDKDPRDFRSLIEGASSLMSRRAMQWDMGFLHPGLQMRVGPTLTGNGLLEFVLDPKIRDRENFDAEPSTARLITRQLLVPFLLGFKFQLSTLLPILFGLMVILSKKALILAKIAVVASSVFGYNSLFSGTSGNGVYIPGGNGYYGNTGPGLSAYGNRYQSDQYLKNNQHAATDEELDPYYATSSNPRGHGTFKTGQVSTPEDLRERLEKLFVTKHGHNRGTNGARNFAWNQ